MARYRTLSEKTASQDPLIQFALWYEDHRAEGGKFAESFSLGTCTGDGKVSVRTVLLKGYGSSGYIFFTNYNSRKGKDLSENPVASMLFFWPKTGRQIRIEGKVVKISAQESDKYFLSRSRESRIGAWISPQSAIIAGKDHLNDLYDLYFEKFRGKPVPRPPHWGGYKIIPEKYEFWQEGKHRLHDRIVYIPVKKGWLKKRLAP